MAAASRGEVNMSITCQHCCLSVPPDSTSTQYSSLTLPARQWNVYLLCMSVSCEHAVRSLMERMGKTLFFRSGGEPLILSEEQREFRKNGRSTRRHLNVCCDCKHTHLTPTHCTCNTCVIVSFAFTRIMKQ